MDLFLFCFFMYVFYLVFRKQETKIKEETPFIKNINAFLNVFFTIFWCSCFIPFTEINSGLFVVGSNSFLKEFRTTLNYNMKPMWQSIVSSIGLILVNCCCCLITYTYRNYEFDGDNIIKKRFRVITLCIWVCRFLITFFYYLNLPIVIKFKHVVVHILCFFSLIDFFENFPFHNEKFARYYIRALIIFYVLMIITTIFIFTDLLP